MLELSILSSVFPFSFLSVLPVILGLVIGYIVIEQFWVWRAAQGMPGPRWVPPFFGNVFEMVYDPFAFWDKQDKFGPLSWNSIFGKFMVFCQSTEHSRTIFSNSANNNFQVCLNLNGERLLGKGNMAFLQGDVHKKLRKQLLSLFTKKALAKYVSLQEDRIRTHMKQWLKDCEKNGTITLRPLIRELNLETSQKVFVGPYLDEDKRKPFNDDYGAMMDGLLCMPWAFPGSTLWRAIRARKRIVALLSDMVARSKAQMRKMQTDSSISAECLLDFWMTDTVAALDKYEADKEAGVDPSTLVVPPHSSDEDVASTLLDFLFAAQDASSSSLTWCAHYLAKYPDVLEKVRAEQKALRPNDEPLSLESLTQMTYTRQVVKEVLRYRAPATLVPHVALDNFKLNDDVTIAKGTLVIPSVFSSSFQGFTEPFKFDPDRFSPERKEDITYSTNFLVFGTGPHRCLGYEYAMHHLLAFTALFATHTNIERVWNDNSEALVYGPTIYPGDGCVLKITNRQCP